MPCMSEPDWEYQARLKQERAMFEALLCASFTLLEDQGLLDQLNWEEAGVTKKDALAWWTSHKKEDEARRKREARRKVKEEKRKQALAKLTPAERKILGV